MEVLPNWRKICRPKEWVLVDPTIIFFIFAAAVGSFQAYSTFKTIRSRRIDDKDYKATMHRTYNLINRTECICSPECLKQSKMIRLNDILSGHDYA